MSQSDHAPTEEGNAAHPIKMAIAVTVGAFGLIVGIILLAQYAVGGHVVGTTVDGANTPEAIAKRIAPVTDLAVAASKAPTAAPTPQAVPAKSTTAAPIVAMVIPTAAPAGAPTATGGEGVYKSACVACHGAGIAGAPKAGDKAAWSARIVQGKPTLYTHAIAGYQGKAGVMPAKGGNASLPDADVKSAVDYMVSLIK